MNKILVTGGSGFIGTNLIEHYKTIGDEVVNFDVVEPRNQDHIQQWRKVDILNSEELIRAVTEIDPDIVFHMAARTDLNGTSIDDYGVNTIGVQNLIKALRGLSGIKRVVFASSMLVCRIGYCPSGETEYCPDTVYGESKVLSEQLIRKEAANHFPWIIVRPTSIWGPWFDVPYRDFFTTIRKGFYVHPRGLRIRRSYGFVLNTVFQLDQVTMIRAKSLISKTIYLADYEPVELKSWADSIQNTLGVRPIREVPLFIFKTAAIFGDLLKYLGYQSPPMSSSRLNNMLTEMVHDLVPLKNSCHDLPYTMEIGVRITCDWLLKENL